MKNYSPVTHKLQEINAKLSPLLNDNFWGFMQKPPLKGICLSLNRNKDTIRDIESYKGFLFVKDKIGNIKTEAKFKGEIDSFSDTVVKLYDGKTSKTDPMSTEIRAQAILIKVMPDYEVIRVDDGSAPSQVDLKATSRSETYTVAIEVTQYIKNNFDKIRSHKKGVYHSDCMKRNWIVHVNNNTAAKIENNDIYKKIVPILVKIESNFRCNEPIEIYTSGLYSKDLSRYTELKINTEIETLSNFNITRVYSKEQLDDQETENGKKSIKICIGEIHSSTADKNKMLKEVLEIAFNECKKKDNQKKLANCSMNEKHLFIIITFGYDKTQYFEKLTDHLESPGNAISIPEEIDEFKEYSAIDVVWIEHATYNASGQVVSSLIKTTKKEGKFVFTLIYNKEPYIGVPENENPICRL